MSYESNLSSGDETIEVPVELLERLDKRAARVQVLLLILKVLIDKMRFEEQGRRSDFS